MPVKKATTKSTTEDVKEKKAPTMEEFIGNAPVAKKATVHSEDIPEHQPVVPPVVELVEEKQTATATTPPALVEGERAHMPHAVPQQPSQ
jgi:methyl coenzyme M reductase subunit C-like uncharacterized protein (methanogenesis marker protein 7)